MALVDLIDVKLSSPNPSPFTAPLEFEITFECLENLEDDLEWKITYVGSAEDPSKDQLLEEVMVGPVPLGTRCSIFLSSVGTSRFLLQAEAPALASISAFELTRFSS